MPVPKLGFVTTFFSSAHTVKEWADGTVTTDAHMRRVTTTPNTTDRQIQAHVYESTASQLKQAEKKGLELSGRITIHTREALKIKSEQNQSRGTLVVFQGQEYEIDFRDIRQAGASEVDRYTYMAVRIVRGGQQ